MPLTGHERDHPLGFLTERRDDKGKFDELFGSAFVHFEMMDKGTLWIGLSPSRRSDKRVSVWIRAEKGKLTVNASED